MYINFYNFFLVGNLGNVSPTGSVHSTRLLEEETMIEWWLFGGVTSIPYFLDLVCFPPIPD